MVEREIRGFEPSYDRVNFTILQLSVCHDLLRENDLQNRLINKGNKKMMRLLIQRYV